MAADVCRLRRTCASHLFGSAYTQLLSQNRNREHSVPNDVLHRMIEKLEIPDYSEAHTVDFVVSS